MRPHPVPPPRRIFDWQSARWHERVADLREGARRHAVPGSSTASITSVAPAILHARRSGCKSCALDDGQVRETGGCQRGDRCDLGQGLFLQKVDIAEDRGVHLFLGGACDVGSVGQFVDLLADRVLAQDTFKLAAHGVQFGGFLIALFV